MSQSRGSWITLDDWGLFYSRAESLVICHCIHTRFLIHPFSYLKSIWDFFPLGKAAEKGSWSRTDCLALRLKMHAVLLLFSCTPSPCFMPFCCNALCQFTPLLNLCCLIFSLMPFCWLYSVVMNPPFWWEYHLWFIPNFFRSATKASNKSWVACRLVNHTWRCLLLHNWWLWWSSG